MRSIKNKLFKKEIFAFSFVILIICHKSSAQSQQPMPSIKKIIFFEDTLQMKKELFNFIPIGTSLDNASNVLRENKINFEIKKDADFLYGTKLLKHLDYIYVDYKGITLEQSGKTWQIALLYKNNVIVDAKVCFKIIGR